MVGTRTPRGLSGCWILLALLLLATSGQAQAQSTTEDDARIQQLEQAIAALNTEVGDLREAQEENTIEYQKSVMELLDEIAANEAAHPRPRQWYDRIRIGSYGEMHANFNDGEPGKNQYDIHRLVLYVGYDFADWIELNSEIEIEHAFSSKGSGGEVLVEQLFLDFKFNRKINARIGRILTPLGITNLNHEPTLFNGVERSSFDKYIIPTTWSSDGIGVYGDLSPRWAYQLYLVNGLDGSGFNAKDGIRGGRMKERPGLNEPAVTGRVDYSPFVGREMLYNQRLRIGASGYWGGLNNGNKGVKPGIDGSVLIASTDASYSISRFDFRGAMAYTHIDGAKEIGNGTAEGIFGGNVEGAYHFMPDRWKRGKLANSDAVVFARFDWFDTQASMPSGVKADPAGQRQEWTFGVTFFPIQQLVLKADYQYRTDRSSAPADHRINFGVGWRF